MATTKQNQMIAGRMVEFQDRFSPLPNDDAQWVIQNAGEAIELCVNAIVNRTKPELTTPKPLLSLISGGEKLMIEKQDGKAYISDAKRTFQSGIGSYFKNWGLNKSGPATEEILLDVNEMTGNGTFVQIFTTLSSDLEKLVMTQAQIIRFCEKYPTWLRQEGYSTFFLTKVNGEYFVVCVYVRPVGLYVRVDRLGRDGVWYGEYRRRVVSPQLMPSVS